MGIPWLLLIISAIKQARYGLFAVVLERVIKTILIL